MNLRIPVLASLFCCSLFAAEPASNAAGTERQLVFKEATKQQVRHSMIGMRDTLLFYTFAAQQAVLVLRVDNADASMPVSGTVHLFDSKTTKEGLGKWVNNQHSDGLFADAPAPVHAFKLPDGTATVTGSEIVGQEKQPTGNGIFNDHKVNISVKAYQVEGTFRLGAFTDDAGVYVKSSNN